MKNRFRIAATAFLACLTLGAPIAAEAAGTLYLYADPDYGVQIGTRTSTGWWNVTAANNDRLSSVKNRTNWTAAFWHDANRTGSCWTLAPYTNDPSFWWWDDNKVSSFGLDRPC